MFTGLEEVRMPRMAGTRQNITADELFAMGRDDQRYELWYGRLRQRDYPYEFVDVDGDGELPVTPPPGYRHGQIQVALGANLREHAREHDLGSVVVEAGFLLERDPILVRAPDVAFVSKERMQEEGPPSKYWPGPPDLCAEVVSPSDTYRAVQQKAGDWIRHGVRMVLVIEPEQRTVAVHRPGQDVRILSEDDTLTGGDVVPGFELSIRELFED